MEDKVKEISLKKNKRQRRRRNERLRVTYWISQGPKSNYKETKITE